MWFMNDTINIFKQTSNFNWNNHLSCFNSNGFIYRSPTAKILFIINKLCINRLLHISLYNFTSYGIKMFLKQNLSVIEFASLFFGLTSDLSSLASSASLLLFWAFGNGIRLIVNGLGCTYVKEILIGQYDLYLTYTLQTVIYRAASGSCPTSKK